MMSDNPVKIGDLLSVSNRKDFFLFALSSGPCDPAHYSTGWGTNPEDSQCQMLVLEAVSSTRLDKFPNIDWVTVATATGIFAAKQDQIERYCNLICRTNQ